MQNAELKWQFTPRHEGPRIPTGANNGRWTDGNSFQSDRQDSGNLVAQRRERQQRWQVHRKNLGRKPDLPRSTRSEVMRKHCTLRIQIVKTDA